MNNRDDQLETLELSIQEAKKNMDLRDSLERLRNNKDFQKIIEEGYFEKEASRLVLLRASPQAENMKDDIDEAIVGIGQLRQYLSRIYLFGKQSEKALKDSEEEREFLLNEPVED